MRIRITLSLISIIAGVFAMPFDAHSQDLKSIKLPPPQTDGGKPLMQALKERKSSREFSPKELPAQVLSDMLWAGFGINRPSSGGRTAPSAMNIQEMDIYIARRDGLYLYNTAENALSQMSAQDIRALTGKQAFVKDAPVNIVYVADTAKMQRVSAGMIDVYAAADAGFISQNVYLFCSSSGLATVVRARVDKEALGKAMSLRPEQKIIFAQTVGYPKE